MQNMTTICFVVLVALFGTAYSSCSSEIYMDDNTGVLTRCAKGCCLDTCCKDIEIPAAQMDGRVLELVLTIVFVVIGVIGALVAMFACCYCYRQRKQQTNSSLIPPQTGFSLHNTNPVHVGYF